MTRFRELRTQRGLSQTELSRTLNVDQTAISKWELGKSFPDMGIAIRVADYFNVSVDYLLGRDDDVGAALVVPDVLKKVQVAFHRGGVEDLTQDEVDRLAEFAMFLQSQRKERERRNDKTRNAL